METQWHIKLPITYFIVYLKCFKIQQYLFDLQDQPWKGPQIFTEEHQHWMCDHSVQCNIQSDCRLWVRRQELEGILVQVFALFLKLGANIYAGIDFCKKLRVATAIKWCYLEDKMRHESLLPIPNWVLSGKVIWFLCILEKTSTQILNKHLRGWIKS